MTKTFKFNTNGGGGVECGYDRKIQNSYISNFAYKTDTYIIQYPYMNHT